MSVPSPFWGGRRVLVTGHTGFKGSWLSLWLHSAGAEVVGFADGVPTDPSLFELAGLHDCLTSIFGDVVDPVAVDAAIAQHRPSVVFHLAAQPLVRRSYADPAATYRTNVLGTVNVLEAVRHVDSVGAVVVITSDKCYDNRGADGAYRESEPLGGDDPYSSSKACAELVTAAYRRSFLAQLGVGVATARAGNVIGGGDWAEDRLVPDLVRGALGGSKVQIRNPDAVRPWQHVLDCLSGYLLLAERLMANGEDGGGGAGTAPAGDAAAAADVAAAWNFGPDPAESRSVGWLADSVAARWGEGLEWVSDGSAHPPEAGALRLDSSRARARLGWRPRWSIFEALDHTVRWYQAYRDDEDLRALTLAQIAAFRQPGRP